ncbi:unnamed protein product [Caenorhabditis nigoni]
MARGEDTIWDPFSLTSSGSRLKKNSTFKVIVGWHRISRNLLRKKKPFLVFYTRPARWFSVQYAQIPNFTDQDVCMTKKMYIEGIFKKHLLLWTKSHFGREHLVHQYDGASAHTAKPTQQWCATHLPGETNGRPTRRILNPLTIPSRVLENEVCSRFYPTFAALEETLFEKCDKLWTVSPPMPTEDVFKP